MQRIFNGHAASPFNWVWNWQQLFWGICVGPCRDACKTGFEGRFSTFWDWRDLGCMKRGGAWSGQYYGKEAGRYMGLSTGPPVLFSFQAFFSPHDSFIIKAAPWLQVAWMRESNFAFHVAINMARLFPIFEPEYSSSCWLQCHLYDMKRASVWRACTWGGARSMIGKGSIVGYYCSTLVHEDMSWSLLRNKTYVAIVMAVMKEAFWNLGNRLSKKSMHL